MIQQLSWLRDGNTLKILGELSRRSVLNSLWDRRLEVMLGITLIDLSAVIRVDTAGVALLVHLVDTGRKQGESVTLKGVSDNVFTLALLYNLPNSILPL